MSKGEGIYLLNLSKKEILFESIRFVKRIQKRHFLFQFILTFISSYVLIIVTQIVGKIYPR